MAHANLKDAAAFKFPLVDFVIQIVTTLFHSTTASTIAVYVINVFGFKSCVLER